MRERGVPQVTVETAESEKESVRNNREMLRHVLEEIFSGQNTDGTVTVDWDRPDGRKNRKIHLK